MKYTKEEKKDIEMCNIFVNQNAMISYVDCDEKGNLIFPQCDAKPIQTLLNLIEKQQKEIEEKDKLICFNRKYINELEQDLFENTSNYVVSKEIIREKIKELKDNRPYLSKFDDWKEKEYINEDINNMCVEVLEDLLGDK